MKVSKALLLLILLISFFVISLYRLHSHSLAADLTTISLSNTDEQFHSIHSKSLNVSDGYSLKDLIRNVSLSLWSSDFHISTIADIKALLLNEYSVSIIDKSLSGHCHLTSTCETNLRVINKLNGINLGNCPNRLKKEFYESYRCDEKFLSMDAFICTHANSMCELFMPFNTSLIVIASTRYEIGRHNAVRWSQWNENLKLIAKSPYSVVAANNKYDQEYIKYFTGIDNVLLVPSYCSYIQTSYNPIKPQILIAPSRGVNSRLANDLFEASVSYNTKFITSQKKSKSNVLGNKIEFVHIRDLYPRFKYSDISSHPAIILLPYQVSFMSLFEFYRMGIPMFIPSPKVLAKWHIDYGILNERTWSTVFGSPASGSPISRNPNSTSKYVSDPNDEYTYQAILEWLEFSDFYRWPHITQFSDFDHLMAQLHAANLTSINEGMMIFNKEEKVRVYTAWEEVLGRVVIGRSMKRSAFSSNRSTHCPLPASYEEALFKSYQVEVITSC